MMNQNYQNFQPYNPYLYQPQNQIPYQNINNIAGKIVDDFNSVSVNDVPMDGSASVFLKRDLSEIQVRKWGSDGRIYSTSFKPFTDDLSALNNNTQTNNQDDKFNGLNERLQAIEDKIDKIIKPTTTKKVSNDVNG